MVKVCIVCQPQKSSGEIKVSGLSNTRARQSDPRLNWIMYHRILKMYEVAYNAITRVTAGVLEILPDSLDSVQDASKVDILPAPITPDPVQTNIKLNSSVTADSVKDAPSLVNLSGSHYPVGSPNYIQSPDYDPVDDDELPQEAALSSENVIEQSPTCTGTSTASSSPNEETVSPPVPLVIEDEEMPALVPPYVEDNTPNEENVSPPIPPVNEDMTALVPPHVEDDSVRFKDDEWVKNNYTA